MNNMAIYEKVRAVPREAKRDITAGRLKGKTDINPMWRIKTLTETFGPCGTGWYVQLANVRIIDGSEGTKVVTVDLNLFYKMENGEWSAPVFGTGGNMLVDKETKGLYTSDEAFKMAYTDALSVCCKMLGVGADVYWEADRTKYSGRTEAPAEAPRNQPQLICEKCGRPIEGGTDANGKQFSAFSVAKRSQDRFGKRMCVYCSKEAAIRAAKIAERVEPAYDPAYDEPTDELPPWEDRG